MLYDGLTFPTDTTDNIIPILHRRKSLTISITILCLLLCLAIIHNAAPIYSSKAQLSFNGHNEVFIKTQMQHIKSDINIRKAAFDLKITTTSELKTFPLPSFNLPIPNITPDFSKFKSFNIYAPNKAQENNAAIIEKIRDNLRISYSPNSYIVNISYANNNAQKASQILRSLIENYIKSENKILSKPSSKQTNNIAPLQNASKAIKHAQAELLTSTKNAGKALENPQYLKVKNKYLILKAEIAPFLNEDGLFYHSNSYSSTALASNLTSKAIEKLYKQKRATAHKLSTLSKRYGDKHPKIKALQAELSQHISYIKQEYNALLQQKKGEYNRAKSTFDALEKEREQYQKSIDTSNEKYKQTLITLEKDLKNLDIILTDIQENTEPADTLSSSIVQIITPPSIPITPIFPDIPKLTALSLLLSILMGILTTVIIEKRRKTFLNGHQVEADLKLPCYALIPETQSDKGKPLADYVLDYPASNVSEAVRALRLSIKLQSNSDEDQNNVILVTSSKENEGKTTLCAWLGRLAAKSGERVLLIDANLRKPSIHKSLGEKNTLSLIEYLGGQHTLEEIIDTSDPSGLNVIYGRSVPNSALNLLSSDKMDQLLRSVKKSYDLIIIDTPASMATSDARALQKRADLLLYIVAWNKTKRNVIHNGISQFTKSGKLNIATVLSSIHIEKHIKFGYGEVINDHDD